MKTKPLGYLLRLPHVGLCSLPPHLMCLVRCYEGLYLMFYSKHQSINISDLISVVSHIVTFHPFPQPTWQSVAQPVKRQLELWAATSFLFNWSWNYILVFIYHCIEVHEQALKNNFTGTKLKMRLYMLYLDCWTVFIFLYIYITSPLCWKELIFLTWSELLEERNNFN